MSWQPIPRASSMPGSASSRSRRPRNSLARIWRWPGRLVEHGLIDDALRVAADRYDEDVELAHRLVLERIGTLRQDDRHAAAEDQRKGLAHHALERPEGQLLHLGQRQIHGRLADAEREGRIEMRGKGFDGQEGHVSIPIFLGLNRLKTNLHFLSHIVAGREMSAWPMGLSLRLQG